MTEVKTSLEQVEMLNDLNFPKWKSSVKDHLQVYGLYEYTQTKAAPDVASEKDKLEWTAGQRKTAALLRTRMEERAHSLVKEIDSAYETWECLETSFKQKGSGNLNGRLHALFNTTLEEAGGDTTKYASNFRKAISQVKQMSSKIILDDNMLIHLFHSGLGSGYETYLDLYIQTHDPFNEDDTSKYTISYAMQRFANSCASKTASAQPTTTALAAVPNRNQMKCQVGAVRGPNSRIIQELIKYCIRCERDYHTVDECHKEHPELAPKRDENPRGTKRQRGGRGGNRSNNGGNQNQFNRQSNQPNQGNNNNNTNNNTNNNSTTGSANNNAGFYMGADADPAYRGFPAFPAAHDGLGPDVWVLDTGCSQHIVCNKAAFATYTEFPAPRSITGLGGSINALGSGAIILNCNVNGRPESITFDNALYVPQAPLNLISTGQVWGKCPLIFCKEGVQVGHHGIMARMTNSRLLKFSLWTGPMPRTRSHPVSAFFSVVNEATLDLWHARLGHLGKQNVTRLSSMAIGIDLSKPINQKEVCEPCCIANTHSEPHQAPIRPGRFENDLIHSDLTSGLTNHNGVKYFVTFMDDKTKYSSVYGLKNKSEVFEAFKRHKAHYEHGTLRIHRLHTDWGGEYSSNEFDAYRLDHGIHWQPTVPGTPEQNGAAERLGQTLMTKVRAMIQETGLDKKWWTELVNTANYIRNRSPVASLSMTPYEAHTGCKPDLSHLRVIGTNGYAMRRKPATGWHKEQERAFKCRLLGYEGEHIWRMLTPDGTVYRASQVKFESEQPKRKLLEASNDEPTAKRQAPSPLGPEGTLDHSPARTIRGIRNPTVAPLLRQAATNLWEQNQPQVTQIVAEAPPPAETPVGSPILTPASSRSASPDSMLYESDLIDNMPQRAMYPPPNVVTRARASVPQVPTRRNVLTTHPQLRERSTSPDPIGLVACAATKYPELLLAFASLALAAPTEPYEPKSYVEAKEDVDWDKWEKGMVNENESLNVNGTYVLVDLPAGRKVLGGKWVYKLKRGAHGEILRYKARWVVRGFEQQEGLDYHETFASVVKPMSQKAIFAIAAAHDWDVDQMDVKTAFLYGNVEEDIYVEQPHHFNDGTGRVCKLNKALYGLKQSPRVWYETLTAFLLERGYKPLTADLNVFAKDGTLVAIYVDDLLLTGPNNGNIKQLKKDLAKRFEMTDMGPVAYYLGMEITRDRANRTLCLNQMAYINKILEDHGMTDAKSAMTPMDSNSSLAAAPEGYEAPAALRKEYQSAVGSLMYVMLGTRPDIAYAISVVSRYGSNPNNSHWSAVQRIFRYLKHTATMRLTYKGPIERITGYTDSDWAGDKDTRRSTSGYIFNLGSAPISWQSKRQATVALSTCEAEYIGQTQAAKEAIWLKELLSQLTDKNQFVGSVIIYGDNQGAIALAKNPQFHARTKHIDIQNHFVREAVTDKKVSLAYVPTDQQVADGLTKPLAKDKFEIFRKALCIA